jgi:hypothetical protein
MHNRCEGSPQFNHPEIPENWKFALKDNPELKVIQVEPSKRFLAVDEGEQETAEYFFGEDGNYFNYKIRKKFPASSDSHLGQTNIHVNKDLEILFRGHDTAFGENADISLAISNLSAGGRLENSLAEFKYDQFKLSRVRLPVLFYSENAKSTIMGPDIYIYTPNKNWNDEMISWCFDVRCCKWMNFKADNSGRHQKFPELRLKNENSGTVFDYSWSVIDKQLVDSKIIRTLVIEQNCLQAGIINAPEITKILEAPLKINRDEINSVVLCEPPYEIVENEIKGGPRRLNVPWTGIGEVIGASLGYSLPLLKTS